jgi:transcriptional regulator with XRE-family HTH domain
VTTEGSNEPGNQWTSFIVPEPESALLRANLGELIRGVRREREWSQAELGRRSGVSGSHISDLELGKRRPRPSCLLSLAKALNPDDAEGLAAEFEAAAGDSLRPDTEPGVRRRRRRERRALEPVPDVRRRLERLVARAQETHARLERRAVGAETDADIRLRIARADALIADQRRQWEAAKYADEQAMMRGLHRRSNGTAELGFE